MSYSTPEHWSTAQIELFSKVHRFMVQHQETFRHPETPVMTPEHWGTVAFNAAWLAAEMLDGDGFEILSDDGQVIARSDSVLNG